MNKTKTSILYCPMDKKTKEFVDENYDRTKDIFEAIGWRTLELCLNDIETNFDEPYKWTYAIKITTINMIKTEELKGSDKE